MTSGEIFKMKSTPTKPTVCFYSDGSFCDFCPTCGGWLDECEKECGNCGQMIDWEETE